jgi:predicted DNA-binding transcriptional regulator AlpA
MTDRIDAFARGLSREAAARYIGVGATLFDAMVADGRMPQPKLINSRRVWDKRDLDAAFDALPNAGPAVDGITNQANPIDGLVV